MARLGTIYVNFSETHSSYCTGPYESSDTDLDSDGLPRNESWIMSAWQKKDYRRHGTYAGRRKYPCAFEQPERTCDDLEYVELHFCGNEIISSSTGKVGELPENIYDLL